MNVIITNQRIINYIKISYYYDLFYLYYLNKNDFNKLLHYLIFNIGYYYFH